MTLLPLSGKGKTAGNEASACGTCGWTTGMLRATAQSMRTQLSHLVNRLVVSAGSPYATAVLAIVLLLFDLLLWLTHLNTTLLLLGSLALSELTVLLLPPILHSTLVGDKATHVKLDALIKALEGVEDRVMGAERLSEAELEALKRDVHEMESNHSA